MGERQGEAWSDEDTALLRQLLEAGDYRSTIAVKLGQTKAAISTEAGQLGPRRKANEWVGGQTRMYARDSEPWSDEEEALLRRLAKAGLSAVDIAPRLQRSREAVATRARKLHLPLTPPASWG